MKIVLAVLKVLYAAIVLATAYVQANHDHGPRFAPVPEIAPY